MDPISASGVTGQRRRGRLFSPVRLYNMRLGLENEDIRMRVRRLMLMVVLSGTAALLAGLPVFAQEQTTYLSLQADTTELQTGQEYTISIRVDNVPELWLATVEIAYDPEKLYVMGTVSGQPVSIGPFFSEGPALDVRNVVENNRISYTVSQLAPAEVLGGSGVLGTFRIFPIAPGKTTLSFRQANITTMTFTGEGDQRVGSDPQPVPFTPVLLELNITGDPVAPPVEATPTPLPTETPVGPAEAAAQLPTQLPTLENIPGIPTSDVGEPAPEPGDESRGITSLAIVGILMVAALVIVGVVIIMRSQRRA